MVDYLFYPPYNSSGTMSSWSFDDIAEDAYYQQSTVFVVSIVGSNVAFEKNKRIGHYILPYEVTIRYEEEEDVICAMCEDLSIVNCAYSPEEAKKGLEQELKDAIHLYVHTLNSDNLDPMASSYRNKLLEIERLNPT